MTVLGGRGGVLPPSTAAFPRRVKRQVARGAQAQTLGPGGGPGGGPKIDSFLGLGGVSGPRRGPGPI